MPECDHLDPQTKQGCLLSNVDISGEGRVREALLMIHCARCGVQFKFTHLSAFTGLRGRDNTVLAVKMTIEPAEGKRLLNG